jgi:hypothetical protein
MEELRIKVKDLIASHKTYTRHYDEVLKQMSEISVLKKNERTRSGTIELGKMYRENESEALRLQNLLIVMKAQIKENKERLDKHVLSEKREITTSLNNELTKNNKLLIGGNVYEFKTLGDPACGNKHDIKEDDLDKVYYVLLKVNDKPPQQSTWEKVKNVLDKELSYYHNHDHKLPENMGLSKNNCYMTVLCTDKQFHKINYIRVDENGNYIMDCWNRNSGTVKSSMAERMSYLDSLTKFDNI